MLLQTERLSKRYRIKGSSDFFAVNEANLFISPGETVAILGDSGSGKTTVALMLAGLLRPSSGSILFRGSPLKYPFKGDSRRDIQILFQHPEVSFNPALPLIRSMTEPYKLYNPPFSKAKLLTDLEKVGLYEEHLARFPSELSGGELQRLALTRLLALNPSLSILDEPTSMLDVITQAQIINLLKDFQKSSGAAFFLITHQHTLAHAVSNRIYSVNNGVFQELLNDSA